MKAYYSMIVVRNYIYLYTVMVVPTIDAIDVIALVGRCIRLKN